MGERVEKRLCERKRKRIKERIEGFLVNEVKERGDV